MSSYIEAPGEVVTITNSTGSPISSGNIVDAGSGVGIAKDTAADTYPLTVAIEGVAVVPKAGVAITSGQPVYGSLGSAPAATGTVALGLYFIGFAAQDAASGDSTVRVSLAPYSQEPSRVLTSSSTPINLTKQDFYNAKRLVLVSGGTTVTVNLPSIATYPKGTEFTLISTASTSTADGYSSETIGGSTTAAVTVGESATFVNTGSTNQIVEPGSTITSVQAAVVSSSSATPSLSAANLSTGSAIVYLSHATPTLTLPAVADVTTGSWFTLVSAGKTVVDGASSEQVNGANTDTVLSGMSATYQTDGSAWLLVSMVATDKTTASFVSSGSTITVVASQFAATGEFHARASNNGTQAVSLISAALVPVGSKFKLEKTGTAGAVTITPTAGTIAGGATDATNDAQGDFSTYISDGTNWLLDATETTVA